MLRGWLQPQNRQCSLKCFGKHIVYSMIKGKTLPFACDFLNFFPYRMIHIWSINSQTLITKRIYLHLLMLRINVFPVLFFLLFVAAVLLLFCLLYEKQYLKAMF